MSSYGTQKPFGQQAVSLTFPTVYERAVYLPPAYYPEPMIHGVNLPESSDLQGDYHRQKMMDAHRMAMAKVQSTVNSDRYAQQYHQNYNVPKPVLSQRRFANPSNGNQADIYSARNVSFDCGSDVWNNYNGGLRGGVLFTQQAQNWGRQQLRNRINQLNAIDAEKQGMQYQPPQTSDVETDNTKVKIEISQTLQAIRATVESGQANNFAFNDTIKFLRLLFRWASTASLDELMEVMEYCEGIEYGLRDLLSQGEDNDPNAGWRQSNPQLEVLLDTFNKVSYYLKGMIKGVNKSFPERKRLSATLVKSLGFTKLPSAKRTSEQEGRLQKEMRRRAGLPVDDDDNDSPYFPPPPPPRDGKPKFDNQPREDLADNNGEYIEDYDGNDGKEDADTFRRGNGEDQTQGLEVGLQEPNPFEEKEDAMQSSTANFSVTAEADRVKRNRDAYFTPPNPLVQNRPIVRVPNLRDIANDSRPDKLKWSKFQSAVGVNDRGRKYGDKSTDENKQYMGLSYLQWLQYLEE